MLNTSHDLGVRIVVRTDWPQVLKGTRTCRAHAHPLLKRLARWLSRVGIAWDPDIVWEYPIMGDADALYDKRTNTIFCSAAQQAAIRRQLERMR